MSLTVWYESKRVPQRIPPELLATTPPTVAMSVEAGSGPELSVMAAEHAVGVAEHGAGPHLHASCVVVQDLDAAPVAADVDQDARALPLAVQARAARPEGDRDAVLAAVGDHAGDARRVARLDDDLRDQAVRARVRRVADEVGGATEHGALAEEARQVGAKRLGRALRDPVGRSVGGGGRHERSP